MRSAEEINFRPAPLFDRWGKKALSFSSVRDAEGKEFFADEKKSFH